MKSSEFWLLCGFCLVYEVTELLALKCYRCSNVYSNYMCVTDNDIHECEKLYDTCQTTVRYSPVSEKMTISKSCSTNASCYNQINATKDLYPCGTSGSWICTTCCYGDLCNLDGGATVFANVFLSVFCLFFGLQGVWPG